MVNVSGQSENNRDKWIMEKMRSNPHTVTVLYYLESLLTDWFVIF